MSEGKSAATLEGGEDGGLELDGLKRADPWPSSSAARLHISRIKQVVRSDRAPRTSRTAHHPDATHLSHISPPCRHAPPAHLTTLPPRTSRTSRPG